MSAAPGARQLALELPHRVAFGMEDFLVADCNREAVGWIDRWPDWPAPLLILSGPEGCGKTHLAHVWQAKSRAAFLDVAELAVADPGAYPDAFALVIENVAAGLGEQAEHKLFHLYNVAKDAGGWLLVTSREPPAAWNIALPDLASRIAGAPHAAIGPPDDAVLTALIVKLFADRQLKPSPEVVSYLVSRIERSFAALRRVVAALDKAALAAGRRVTVPLARRVLEEMN